MEYKDELQSLELMMHVKLEFTQIDFKEDSSIWICGLLLAILFQDRDIFEHMQQ